MSHEHNNCSRCIKRTSVAWSYPQAYAEVARISNFVSFEPDIVSVQLDGTQVHLERGQSVIAHGPDRDLTAAQLLPPASAHT